MFETFLNFFVNHLDVTIIGISCIIQVSPIKINPWSALFSWIGGTVNHDLAVKIDKVETRVQNIDEEVKNERVQNIRWNILGFSNSCRRNILHTKEEWDHCLCELEWYEEYCKLNSITNGVIEENAKWLRRRYQNHLDNNDFLKD